MNKEQKFIELYSFKKMSYSDIEKEMIISRTEVQNLYKVCKEKISEIQIIYNKFNSRQKLESFRFECFETFYNWHSKQPETCCYCGVSQSDAIKSKVYDNLKRKTRGISLEIERVITFPENKNLYSPTNCRLACHVCNNAKSDFFSVQDFKYIALGINKFWSNKLNKDIIFPIEVYMSFDENNKDINE